MKRLLVVLMMLCPMVVMGQTNPAAATDFPLTVHVVASNIEPVAKNVTNSVREVDLLNVLRVTIAGKKYVLAVAVYGSLFGGTHPVLIVPGDYPARVTLDQAPHPGQVRRTYELLLADGTAVKARLWGIGG